jgi:hypothetical protein
MEVISLKGKFILSLMLLCILVGCQSKTSPSPTNQNSATAETKKSSPKILFDQGHGQTAGNADWTIQGGYSDFAKALNQAGYVVESTHQKLTSSLLQGYQVLILPEPNINYTTDEKRAINDFVKQGGGVYLIADHTNSDRNHDGWDSVDIFNGYSSKKDEWVGRIFGFSFHRKNITQSTIKEIHASPLTKQVKEVGCWACTTIRVTKKNPSIIKDITIQSEPYHIHGTYGSGRFAALGDSSPYDDGTGDFKKKLHPNWGKMDHAKLAVQTVKWLANNP